MKLKRTVLAGGAPVFGVDSSMQVAQGGFNLDLTGLIAGAVVPAGSVLGYDEATRIAQVLKAATVLEAVADGGKAIKVAKGHLFKAGDFVSANGKSTAIVSVDTSNANYDVLNITNEIDAIAVSAALMAGKAEVAANAALFVEPKGLLWNAVTVPADDYVFVDVVISHKNVYARRIPAVSDAVKAKLPNIIFSQSY